MGSGVSTASIDPAHIRIYNNIVLIKDVETKLHMMEMCMSSQEYILSAKRAGIYVSILNYISSFRKGNMPDVTPVINNKEEEREETNIVRSSRPALSFFSSCLHVLGIKEDVEIDEESLRIAYRAAALRAHPDKGGTEEKFDKVTRAYAYLSEILKRVRGNGKRANTLVEIEAERNKDIGESNVESPHINPKNMNMNVFNKLFEENRIPDPDNDGYGDWLKANIQEKGEGLKTFGKDFNRSVFNRAFEQEEGGRSRNRKEEMILHPSLMAVTSSIQNGVELGRERPENYTSGFGNKIHFTDVKNAYTDDATITHKVAGIRNNNSRKFDEYVESRKSVPSLPTSMEAEELNEVEKEIEKRELRRRRKVAQESMVNEEYADRLKRRMIVDQ